MREQDSTLSARMLAGAIAALALLLSLVSARAGDPIQFSNEKAKPAPTESRPDAELFKAWNKSRPPASPLRSLTPFIGHGPGMDPKDERRIKNERDERKNWMLLEPGELQKRDEEEDMEFGGRGVAIDDINDDNKGSYLFHNVTQTKAEKPKAIQRAADETGEQPKKDARSTMSVFGTREGEQHGAHTATELNLKGLIDPAQVAPANLDKNEASLFQFFKDNALPPPDRDQQARRDNFRDFINGPQQNVAPSGFSDPINFRTDLTQERMNPIMPSRPFELPGAPKAPDTFSAKPPLGGGLTPGRAPGLPEMMTAAPRQPLTGPSLPSPFLSPNDQPKSARPSVIPNNSLFNREAPRRGGF